MFLGFWRRSGTALGTEMHLLAMWVLSVLLGLVYLWGFKYVAGVTAGL